MHDIAKTHESVLAEYDQQIDTFVAKIAQDHFIDDTSELYRLIDIGRLIEREERKASLKIMEVWNGVEDGIDNRSAQAEDQGVDNNRPAQETPAQV